MKKITPFLMFQEGNAEEAMNYYVSLFDNSKINNIVRFDAGGAGDEGKVMQGSFTLNNQEFMCTDSNIKHAFTFTPSFSNYITCESEEEINRLYDSLLTDGKALMPLDNYGFSKKFGWVNDRFGISWQLNLAE